MTAICYIHNYNDTILTTIYTNFGLKRENMGGEVESDKKYIFNFGKGIKSLNILSLQQRRNWGLL